MSNGILTYSIMKYVIFSVIVLVLSHTMLRKNRATTEGYGGGHGYGRRGGWRGGHGYGRRGGWRGGGGWGWTGWDYPMYYQEDYPVYYPAYYPSYIIGGHCKNGCGNLGNGEVGCVNPGYGYDNCIFASDCTGCVF